MLEKASIKDLKKIIGDHISSINSKPRLAIAFLLNPTVVLEHLGVLLDDQTKNHLENRYQQSRSRKRQILRLTVILKNRLGIDPSDIEELKSVLKTKFDISFEELLILKQSIRPDTLSLIQQYINIKKNLNLMAPPEIVKKIISGELKVPFIRRVMFKEK